MKKIILSTFIILFASIALNISRTEQTYAACNDAEGHYSVNAGDAEYRFYSSFSEVGGTDRNNDRGVEWACYNSGCTGSGNCAILFFTDSNGFSSLGNNNYRFNVNITLHPDDTNAEIGVMGMGRRNNDGDIQSAKKVALCTSSPCSSTDTSVFRNVPSEIARGGSNSGFSNWTIPGAANVKKIRVNVSQLVRRAALVRSEMNYNVYKVYNYRCYYWDVPSSCGESPMYIAVKKNRQVQFTGKTTITSATDSHSGNNYTLNTSDGNYSVVFHHVVKRTAEGGITLTNKCDVNASGVGAVYSVNKYGHSTNNCTFSSTNVGDNKVVDQTVTGTIYPGQTIKICQSVKYYAIVHSLYGGSDEKNSAQACITITRPQGACALDTSLKYDYAGGTNIGRLGVRNSSKNSNYNYSPTTGYSRWTTEQYAADVFAKPGDSIQFRYDMCAGAGLANDLNVNPKKSYSYSVSSTSSTGNDAAYRFGVGPTLWDSSNISNGNYEKNGVTSPNSNDYSCSAYGGFVANHYQVPGLTARNSNCKSSTKTKASDVGSMFSQTLNWDALSIYGRTNVSDSGRTYKATGRVYVPYNYKLKATTSETTTIRNMWPGGSTAIKLQLAVTSRKNSDVQNANYSTNTKPTNYTVYQWYENSNMSAQDIKNSLGDAVGSNDGYYSRTNPLTRKNGVRSVAGSSRSSVYGADSTTSLNSDIRISASENASIGAKICAAAVIWPADSHNNPNRSNVGGRYRLDVALSIDGTGYYISEPTCYTISKRPSFAVLGNGVLAINGIEAASFESGSIKYTSWSEYTAASKAQIKGFATGASTWGGAAVLANMNCVYSSMTLANTNCGTSLGELSQLSSATSSSPHDIVEQVKKRYVASTDSANNAIKKVKNSNPITIEGGCVYNNGRYVAKNLKGNGSYFNCLANATAYFEAQSGVTLNVGAPNTANEMWQSPDDEYASNTTVVVADKIVINQNFHYGNTTQMENTVYTSVTQKPQMIFIAKDSITVAENVTNIDGWLIAPTINTCNVKASEININRCNKQLRVNGPVFTKHLNLYRTYGAGQNETSSNPLGGVTSRRFLAEPAEVFTVGAETYYWAYSQSARYSQAYTTYQRELPTRY